MIFLGKIFLMIFFRLEKNDGKFFGDFFYGLKFLLKFLVMDFWSW